MRLRFQTNVYFYMNLCLLSFKDLTFQNPQNPHRERYRNKFLMNIIQSAVYIPNIFLVFAVIIL